MKTAELPVSAWFFTIGSAAAVLIGAFGNFRVGDSQPGNVPQGAVASTGAEASAPENLSPGMAEVVRLAQAHVDPGVMLAYIQNSRQQYSPTAEELLYLSSLGVPQEVLAAFFPVQPVPSTPPAPPTIAAVAANTSRTPQHDGTFAEATTAITSKTSFFDNNPPSGLPVDATLTQASPQVDDEQPVYSSPGSYPVSMAPVGALPPLGYGLGAGPAAVVSRHKVAPTIAPMSVVLLPSGHSWKPRPFPRIGASHPLEPPGGVWHPSEAPGGGWQSSYREAMAPVSSSRASERAR